MADTDAEPAPENAAAAQETTPPPLSAGKSEEGPTSFARITHAAEFFATQAATQAAGLFTSKSAEIPEESKTSSEKVVEEAGEAADAEVTNATSSVGDVGGSFSRFTQAAEVFASQAATQAAGLFTYKSTDQSQETPSSESSTLPSSSVAARFSHAAELLAAQATMATASASATAAAAASVFYKKEETQEESAHDDSFSPLADAAEVLAAEAMAEAVERIKDSEKTSLTAPSAELTEKDVNDAEQVVPEPAISENSSVEMPSMDIKEQRPEVSDESFTELPKDVDAVEPEKDVEEESAAKDDAAGVTANASSSAAAASSAGSFTRLTALFLSKEPLHPEPASPSDAAKDAARSDASVDGSTGTFTRFTHAAEVLATQAATQAAELFAYKKAGDETKSQEMKEMKEGMEMAEGKEDPPRADKSTEEGTTGSFSRLTHAAEALASQAATQAAEFFSYKKAQETAEKAPEADVSTEEPPKVEKVQDSEVPKEELSKKDVTDVAPLDTTTASEDGSFTRLTQWAQQAGFHQAAEWLTTEQVDQGWTKKFRGARSFSDRAWNLFKAPEETKDVAAGASTSRPSLHAVGRCWRCGQEILAELEAVEAHEETCSRPMQQLLDAAELLTGVDPPESPMPPASPDESGPDPDPPDADHPADATDPGPTSPSRLLSWTTPGVNALVGLKDSVKETSTQMVHRAYRAAGALGGPKSSPDAPLTPDLDPVQVYTRIEDTVETLVLLVLDPVLKGIPSLGILPVRIEARRSVGEHGTPEAAVQALMAKAEAEDAESGMSQRFIRKVSELLVMRFLPVVGAGAFLSYTIYARLRLAALVAEMNGHDSEDPEVQGLLFFSILPGGEAHADIDSTSPKAAGENHDGVLESPKGNAAMSGTVALRAARGLGHGLARQVLQRSTGWRSASDLYDLAAAICSERESEEAGPQTCTVQRAQLLFQPSRSKHPVLLLLLAFGALAPLLVALASLLWRWCPRLGAGVLLSALLSAIFWRWELVDLATEHPQWVTSLVLMIHALLPLFAAFSSTRLIVEGLLSRHSMATLATESGSGLLFLLLGAWTWLRLWQRMQADGDGSKGHSTAMLQRALLGLLLSMGTLDLFGVDAFAFHSIPAFGTLRSSHWFVGVLQVQALECQLQLLALLKQREVLLRLLGATHMMGLAVLLFLGGVTASVGFLVSRQDFLRFVDGLAPPPKITAAIVMLRRERSVCALALGGAAGVLWQLPQGTAAVALVTKMGGMMLGATAAGLFFSTFEEFRTALLEPSGGRWLMVFPETSEKAKTQASEMWSKLKFGAAGAAAEKGAIYIGHGVLDSLLNYLGTLWVGGKAVEKIVEAEMKS